MAFSYIDSNDLKYWSGQTSSKSELPNIISQLIRATTPSLKTSLIPKGISTYNGGWDGIVSNDTATQFVPDGTSLWEMGTQQDPKLKAEKDYKKRVAEPLGQDLSTAIFVFVTTRSWKGQQKWIDDKKAEKIFHDIKVIDVDTLVEWIGMSPVISQEISRLIGRKVDSQCEPLMAFWDTWATGPKQLKLSASLVCAGRDNIKIELLDKLNGPPSVIPIKAGTKEEAIAFVVATLIIEYSLRLDRAIIVNTKENILELMATSVSLIIARIPQPNVLFSLTLGRQHIILPLGIADNYQDDQVLVLPKLGREESVAGLRELGLGEDQARSLSKETGRNINVIRRRLGFDGTEPNWADYSACAELLPALLVGKWSGDKEGDRQIIEYLSQQKYDDYIEKINKWTLHHDPPLINIGSGWRLASPLDAWNYLGVHISSKQLKLLGESFLVACGDIKPSLILEPEQRFYASFFGKIADFSHAIREGLAQSLILIALYGDEYKLQIDLTSQLWVDNLVSELVGKADQQLWKSLNDILPVIAEASPSGFLTQVERFLHEKPQVIGDVFEAAPNSIHADYYHTGLLWAIEGLAWLPEYILRASLALMKLSELDPGVKILNRPVNSLHQIFQPIMPQTYANPTERIQVLKTLSQKYPAQCWHLFLGLLPGQSMVGHTNVKLRWRDVVQEAIEQFTDEEYYQYVNFLSNKLCQLAGNDVVKIHDLLTRFEDLDHQDRIALLQHIRSNVAYIIDKEYIVWQSIREILHNCHSEYHPLQHLNDALKDSLKEVYQALTPKGITESLLWVFDTHWARFPEGFGKFPRHGRAAEQYMEKRQVQALKAIYLENDFDTFLSLISKVKEPSVFGKTAALIGMKTNENLRFALLVSSEDKSISFAATRFIFFYHIRKGTLQTIKLYNKLLKEKKPNEALVNFLLAMRSDYETWQFVATQTKTVIDGYWKLCDISLSHREEIHIQFELEHLLQYNRFISAIYLCVHNNDSISTETMIKILTRLATEEVQDPQRLDSYHITHLFEQIYIRDNYDLQQILKLEWLYAELLTGRHSHRRPIQLYKELSTNPQLFVELITFAFRPDYEELEKKETESISQEAIISRAKKAHGLLDGWDTVPGHSVDQENKNQLDSEQLKKWVYDARRLATDQSRLNKADIFIGKILAKYPENNICWPPDSISEIIEDIDSEHLRSNFSMTVTNKRSFTSRSPFAGGQIERNNAAYFRKFENCHRLTHPVTAKIFEDIATRYDLRAKQEDNEALANDLDY